MTAATSRTEHIREGATPIRGRAAISTGRRLRSLEQWSRFSVWNDVFDLDARLTQLADQPDQTRRSCGSRLKPTATDDESSCRSRSRRLEGFAGSASNPARNSRRAAGDGLADVARAKTNEIPTRRPPRRRRTAALRGDGVGDHSGSCGRPPFDLLDQGTSAARAAPHANCGGVQLRVIYGGTSPRSLAERKRGRRSIVPSCTLMRKP